MILFLGNNYLNTFAKLKQIKIIPFVLFLSDTINFPCGFISSKVRLAVLFHNQDILILKYFPGKFIICWKSWTKIFKLSVDLGKGRYTMFEEDIAKIMQEHIKAEAKVNWWPINNMLNIFWCKIFPSSHALTWDNKLSGAMRTAWQHLHHQDIYHTTFFGRNI